MNTVWYEGIEYPVSFEPFNDVVQVRDLGNGRVRIGYLAVDDSGTTDNPCTEGCGMGLVGTCHRHEDRTLYEACANGEHKLFVALDIYDHGGRVYAVSGSARARSFPDQQWDVAHKAGVWVPDSEALNHIHLKAAEKMGFKIEVLETACCAAEAKDCKPWRLVVRHATADGKLTKLATKRQRYYSDWHKAAHYAMYLARRDQGAGALQAAIMEAATECAEQCLETYNSWCSGDIWGVCTDVVEDGKIVEDHACWGYIGREHAEQSLKEEMES